VNNKEMIEIASIRLALIAPAIKILLLSNLKLLIIDVFLLTL